MSRGPALATVRLVVGGASRTADLLLSLPVQADMRAYNALGAKSSTGGAGDGVARHGRHWYYPMLTLAFATAVYIRGNIQGISNAVKMVSGIA